MGILRRFMRYFAKNTIKQAENYKTPCNPNAHWDRKRCKSCECYQHNRLRGKCIKNNANTYPLDNACKEYKKRKSIAREAV